jgi:hypothetical protein
MAAAQRFLRRYFDDELPVDALSALSLLEDATIRETLSKLRFAKMTWMSENDIRMRVSMGFVTKEKSDEVLALQKKQVTTLSKCVSENTAFDQIVKEYGWLQGIEQISTS